jgi:phosphoglycolate phosphatase
MNPCVLFDLDGTLADTAEDFILVLNELLAAEKKQPLAAELVRTKVSGGSREMVKLAFGGHPGEPAFDRLLKEFLDQYGEIIDQGKSVARLYPGVKDVLNALDAAEVPWGVVTNKPVRFAEPLMPQLSIAPPVLVCPDHVSKAKPDPEALLLGSKQLNCSAADSIYVGDHERDIIAGRAAAMTTVAVGWGYLAHATEHHQWGADHIIDAPEALASVLPQ